VLPQTALEIIGLANVEPTLGIFEDVDVEFGHEKSVIGRDDANKW
jgi:hypothetical protein